MLLLLLLRGGEEQAEEEAGPEAETEQLRGTRPACCPSAESPSARRKLGPLCWVEAGGKEHEGGEEKLPEVRRPPPPLLPIKPTRIREQTAASALSNLEGAPSSSPLPFAAGATGSPPTALHSSRTWSGVGNDAHQLILVPPPSVEPASAVAERSREEHSVPRS